MLTVMLQFVRLNAMSCTMWARIEGIPSGKKPDPGGALAVPSLGPFERSQTYL